MRSWLTILTGFAFIAASLFSHGAIVTVAVGHGLHSSLLLMGPPIQG